jgi:hypothetical protein
MDIQGIMVQLYTDTRDMSLLQIFQIGPGAHTVPYSMDTAILTPGDKVGEA